MLEASPPPTHNTKMRGFSIMSGSIYNCYVYAYIRSKDSINGKAGTPYYIGKGKGKRMYAKHCSVRLPNDPQFIIILENNLSNIGALALERRYIKWYGRLDQGTGILRNMTDGGDGNCGAIVTADTRMKRSNSLKGRSLSEDHKRKIGSANKGSIITEERKKYLSDINKGKILSEEVKNKIRETLKGRPRSEEVKRKIKETKRINREKAL